jgi:hypothetical protein
MVLPDGCIVHKIGMTNSNRATDRMLEILRSWFSKYRFIPYTELRLDLECLAPAELEKHMHKILAKKRFIPNEDVDGKTEMFTDINEFRVIHYLKAFNSDLFKDPLNLTDRDYGNLCKLISP